MSTFLFCNASQLDFLTDALNKVRVYSFGEVPFELLMETHSVVKNYKYILFNSSLIYFSRCAARYAENGTGCRLFETCGL